MSIEIFVPAYGPSPYLEECLNSILLAKRNGVVCTVLDDASPTSQVLEITKKFGSEVQYFRNAVNLGLAANFQKAMSMSTSDFTIIIGSDDRLLPNYFQSIESAAGKFPDAALIQPRVQVIDQGGLPTKNLGEWTKKKISPSSKKVSGYAGDEILRRLLIGDFLYFPAIAWNTNLLKQYPFDQSLKTAVDLDVLLRLAIDGHQFVLSDQIAFEYRRHEGSVSSRLLQDLTRIDEELDVQIILSRQLIGKNRTVSGILGLLAFTIRMNALLTLLRNPKMVLRNPLSIFRIFRLH